MSDNEMQVKILKAIAHPVRMQILRILQEGALCAGRTNTILSISQPNFSQHLKVLREAGLIERVCKGTRHCYYLAMPALVDAVLGAIEQPESITKTPEEIFEEIEERCVSGISAIQ